MSTSVGQSELVRMLAPPVQPKVPRNTVGCVVLLLAFLGTPSLLAGLSGLAQPNATGAGSVLVIGLAFCGGAVAV